MSRIIYRQKFLFSLNQEIGQRSTVQYTKANLSVNCKRRLQGMGEELLIFFVWRVNNFWFFPVMNGQEEGIFWGFGCCCFPAKKVFEARHWRFPVACLVYAFGCKDLRCPLSSLYGIEHVGSIWVTKSSCTLGRGRSMARLKSITGRIRLHCIFICAIFCFST